MIRKYKQKSSQVTLVGRRDQENLRVVTLWPKETQESRTGESLSTEYKQCRSLMGLQVEMLSADADMDVDEPRGPVMVQLRTPDVRTPKREPWKQRQTARSSRFHRVSNQWLWPRMQSL
jgi:hypothetical protein